MNRACYNSIRPILLLALGASLTACGSDNRADVGAGLELAPQRAARIALKPALDLSQLIDGNLASRLVIDRITINVEDARLLSADPSMPTGGFGLIEAPALIDTLGQERPEFYLPFPENFLGQDDLAVYMRIVGSPQLEGASVEIEARLFGTSNHAQTASLNAAESGSRAARLSTPDPDVDPARPNIITPDPDVDPARPIFTPDPDVDPARPDFTPDPDVDPALPHATPDPDVDPARPDQTPDPDVDPAHEVEHEEEEAQDRDHRHYLASSSVRQAMKREAPTREGKSVSFILRDNQAADLLVTLGQGSRLNVTLGVPATRWFTPAVINHLEQALAAKSQMLVNRKDERRADRAGHNKIIEIQLKNIAPGSTTSEALERSNPQHASEYFLADDQMVDRNTLRR